MKQKILFLLLSFYSMATTAQNFEWAKILGGPAGGTGKDIVVDATGNVYTVGDYGYNVFTGPADFDPGPATFNFTLPQNGSASFFSKLNSNGNFVWARSFPSISGVGGVICRVIAFDQAGNLVVAGLFNGTADFDLGPGIFNLTASEPFGPSPNNPLDFFVAKYTPSGNFLWAKSMPGNALNEVYDLTVDAQNNILITGYFLGEMDADPSTNTSIFFTGTSTPNLFVVKLTDVGNYIWAKQLYDVNGSSGHAIKTDSIGQVYITGGFAAVDFDPGPGTVFVSSVGL